jgi:hypothetical protein
MCSQLVSADLVLEVLGTYLAIKHHEPCSWMSSFALMRAGFFRVALTASDMQALLLIGEECKLSQVLGQA